jgi:hypothetical protein
MAVVLVVKLQAGDPTTAAAAPMKKMVARPVADVKFENRIRFLTAGTCGCWDRR